MNILALVATFLLIFSFLSASSMKKLISFESEKKSFIGFMQARCSVRNMWENKKFLDETQKLRPKVQTAIQKELERTIRPSYLSHRKNKNLPSLAKLNIAPLLEKEKVDPLLYETTSRLLSILYGHTSFFKQQEGFVCLILDAIIKKGKNLNKPATSLADLFPEESKLEESFYKMLQGTGEYDLAQKSGYPALSDFIRMEPLERKPIYFSYASAPLLEALFGKKVASDIVAREEEKSKKDFQNHCLKRAELEAILLEERDKNLSHYEPLVNFAKKKGKLEALRYQDRSSGISFLFRFPKKEQSEPGAQQL